MSFINLRDYVEHRVRIEPVGFDMAETLHGRRPRMWAKVTVLDLELDLGTVEVFQSALINQIKYRYVGRPVVGTLVRTTLVPGSLVLQTEEEA
jgi:hypothetical protein